ncbi:AraC family transcriptional regulator [Sphingobacterium faecium NBRC 15299]|uniref:helix-turn-helix domain-containing protein n=1 Tax=Sphingobacterium faecium TaxID=34087 RepID=UPI000D36E165|nr:AraC family transcriptional regulator [Sphingobacterium faecium]PTX06945.1 AraC family transcriptional regulator [Sphingobacterium faecium]GEM66297.1 AraC family transcriptional regulator [Sphingobacterium faecium NBRC 15299]
MKNGKNINRLQSINEIHDACGLPKPKHPLISLTHIEKESNVDENQLTSLGTLDFYKITFVLNNKGRLRYGQDYYDFNEGSMMFLAPNQVVGSTEYSGSAEWFVLFIHPDYFLGHPLAKKIKQYGFFSYTNNEALHLSEKEKDILLSVFYIIQEELNERIDEFSQEVILSQIDLLMNYANRFYKRQFITRKTTNKDILHKTEAILDDYFNNEKAIELGIPSVQYISEKLNISPGYLSDLLRSLIGQNAKQYIHYKLIEKAKEKLSTTDSSVSEIAFELGFEHSQSFNKLFKQKTNVSPLEFRALFN